MSPYQELFLPSCGLSKQIPATSHEKRKFDTFVIWQPWPSEGAVTVSRASGKQEQRHHPIIADSENDSVCSQPMEMGYGEKD
jgi:hypothetical protein